MTAYDTIIVGGMGTTWFLMQYTPALARVV